MKRKLILLATLISLFGCDFMRSPNSQSVSIKKTDTSYQFIAEFPERKGSKVFNYMKETLKDEKLFNNPDEYKDQDVNLGDSIRFHLISQPGYLRISFKKSDNLARINIDLERMCGGIKEVLK